MFKSVSALSHRMLINTFLNYDIFDKDSHSCKIPKMHSGFILDMCLTELKINVMHWEVGHFGYLCDFKT